MAYLQKDELGDALHSAKDSAKEWFKPFDEYEQLEANQPSPNLPEHYMQVTDGTINQLVKTQTTPRTVQYEDSEFKVMVKSGYDRCHDSIVTDLLIFDKQNKKEHYHLVIDEYGNELFSEWRVNH